MLKNYLAIDLETTGLKPGEDEIIEVGLVKVEEGKVVDTFTTLVRPLLFPAQRILELTGITRKELSEAPTWLEVKERVETYLQHYPVVGYNVGFDVAFLRAQGIAVPEPVFDVLVPVRIFYPHLPSYQLSEVLLWLGLAGERCHRALDDALAVVRLMEALACRVRELPGSLVRMVADLLYAVPSPWAATVIRTLSSLPVRMERKNSVWLAAPLLAGAEEGEDKIEGENSEADAGDRVDEVVIPGTGTEVPVLPEELTVDFVLSFFDRRGLLAGRMSSYEYRQAQVDMARMVSEALLADDTVLLVEAGTGTGKSIAYLLPAALFALIYRKRIVIATCTVNLQDQLWEKEVPLLKQVLPWRVRSVLFKGRQNYLCLRRWRERLEWAGQGRSVGEEGAFLARVLLWLQNTTTGDRRELNLRAAEEEWWQGVCSQSEYCAGKGCHFWDECFVNRVRRQAEESQLIITNHSLLLTDCASESGLLPSYDALIIDEAHHLEDVATDALTLTVDNRQFYRYLTLLEARCRRWGMIPHPLSAAQWEELHHFLLAYLGRLQQAGQRFFTALIKYVTTKVQENGVRESNGEERVESGWLRLIPGLFQVEEQSWAEEWFALTGIWKELLVVLKKAGQMAALVNEESWEQMYREIEQESENGRNLLQAAEFVLGCSSDEHVFWLQLTGREGAEKVTLAAAPISPASYLRQNFWPGIARGVLTSATLTVDGSFTFFQERVGLDRLTEKTVTTAIIPSPFNYEQQARLLVVKDLPSPGPQVERKYLEGIADAIASIAMEVGGRTLVLFTSYQAMNQCRQLLLSRLEQNGLALLVQGIDGSRVQLVQAFKSSPRSVLFGTGSLWEGIDIPGRALSCVVIVKLPFANPNQPIFIARKEEMEREKKDWFWHYSLPSAVITFKQGFGRLIRTFSDCGIVVVLDSRLSNRRYGRVFLNSLPLPAFPVKRENLVREIRDFLERWSVIPERVL